MLCKFFIYKDTDFLKRNNKIYAIFFSTEILIALISYILKITDNISELLLGYIENPYNILFITINKLFIVSFILFIITKKTLFFLEFSNTCFIGRIKKRKLHTYSFIFNVIHIFSLFLGLLIISFVICGLLKTNFNINFNNLFKFILIISLFSNLYCIICEETNKIYFLVCLLLLFLMVIYNNYISTILLVILNLFIIIILPKLLVKLKN